MTKQKSETIKFNKNYLVLKEVAEKLRNQEEPDIDALVSMVTTASKAYDNCKTRLNEVQKLLNEHFEEE